MISETLLERLACPVCLEGSGEADYTTRVRAPEGPDKQRLRREAGALACPSCGARYAIHPDAGYVDLVPKASVGEVTQYADHEFHERLGVSDAPPVLSARVKADVMRRMLDPRAGEPVLDLGCGAGKLALYAGSGGARSTGVDVAPFFLPRAAREVDLVRGDLRRLPFRKGAFPRAYTLDVLEHLDEAGVKEVLVEARRVLGPEGRLFVYTHAMESSRLASFQRWVNRLARRLGERGLIDHEREAMRKSDHVNAIASHEHFEALCAEAGLEVAERRYYNVVFKAVVEDLLLRLFEQWRRRRARRAPVGGHDGEPADPRAAAVSAAAGGRGEHAGAAEPPRPRSVGAPPPHRALLLVASALTWLLKLDVVLFGGIRTGPFFALLRPRSDTGKGA